MNHLVEEDRSSWCSGCWGGPLSVQIKGALVQKGKTLKVTRTYGSHSTKCDVKATSGFLPCADRAMVTGKWCLCFFCFSPRCNSLALGTGCAVGLGAVLGAHPWPSVGSSGCKRFNIYRSSCWNTSRWLWDVSRSPRLVIYIALELFEHIEAII